MSNQSLKRPAFPRIPEFYEGKSVFMTGATGFLGVILLEALLRICPGIKRIYILVRTKKGVEAENRKESIFKKPVFAKLKEKQPDVFKKVYVIPGDVSLPDLGMDEIGLLKVIQNVDIVFHCAATVNFLKSFRYTLTHNSVATQYVIDVCRKLRNLDALVYTSTAFSNCNRRAELPEKIYRLPFHANKFLDELRNGKDSSLRQLVNQCQPHWPNAYTFSKSLSENIIQDNAADLPTVIVRPSLIFSVWKEPLPGYVEDSSGITELSVGAGKGFVRVLHADPEVRLDLIPVDVVAHTHIIAATRASTERSSSPWIVNCTSFYVITLRKYTDVMTALVFKHPVPNTFRTPTKLKLINNDFYYWLTSIYEHYIPAYVFDLILKLSGSKIRLISKYKFVDAAIKATHFFLTHCWDIQTENFQKFMMDLHPEDKQLLGTSCKGSDLESISDDVVRSAPFFQWQSDKKSPSDRMFVAKQRYLLTSFIQFSFVFAVVGLTYVLGSQVFQLIYST